MAADELDTEKPAGSTSAALANLRRGRLPAALAGKAFAAERRLAGLRLVVVICNLILYLAFVIRRPETEPVWANAVVTFGVVYSLYVLIAEPYRRYPVFMAGYLVSTADAVASTLWIGATGGVHSPFFLLLYLLPVGAAFRHRTGDAVVATAVFAASYAGLLALRGELVSNLPEVTIRIAFIFLAAGIGLLMAREIVEQAVGRLELASRARAEDARLRLAAIVDSSADAIVGLLPDGTVESWNDRAAEVFGWSLEEIREKPAAILLSPGYWDVATDILRRVRGGELVEQLETMGVRKDGRVFNLALVASPIRDAAGAVSGIALIGRDVTERKQLEARLLVSERMASLGTLAAGIAHEVNNPLAYVTANLEFVIGGLREADASAQGGRTSELIQALTEAHEGADRVRKAMGDLKTFSRPDDKANGPVDVRRVVESAVNIAWNEIQQRALLVNECVDVPKVQANESQLAQVVLNLIMNALQSMREGDPARNEIRIATRRSGLDRVAIEVRDTGSGISEEVRGRIFDPYFTTKPVGTGMGLGLSVCHSIVTLLGGEIEVESEIGHGSLFRVLLPIAK
jgi:PAS domain S-box-containing protein